MPPIPMPLFRLAFWQCPVSLGLRARAAEPGLAMGAYGTSHKSRRAPHAQDSMRSRTASAGWSRDPWAIREMPPHIS